MSNSTILNVVYMTLQSELSKMPLRASGKRRGVAGKREGAMSPRDTLDRDRKIIPTFLWVVLKETSAILQEAEKSEPAKAVKGEEEDTDMEDVEEGAPYVPPVQTTLRHGKGLRERYGRK